MPDRGGWASFPMREIRCPKCGNDHAKMFDTELYGKSRTSIFCKQCAHDWVENEERDGPQSDR